MYNSGSELLESWDLLINEACPWRAYNYHNYKASHETLEWPFVTKNRTRHVAGPPHTHMNEIIHTHTCILTYAKSLTERIIIVPTEWNVRAFLYCNSVQQHQTLSSLTPFVSCYYFFSAWCPLLISRSYEGKRKISGCCAKIKN